MLHIVRNRKAMVMHDAACRTAFQIWKPGNSQVRNSEYEKLKFKLDQTEYEFKLADHQEFLPKNNVINIIILLLLYYKLFNHLYTV